MFFNYILERNVKKVFNLPKLLTNDGGNIIWFLKKNCSKACGDGEFFGRIFIFCTKMPKFAGLMKKNLNVVV